MLPRAYKVDSSVLDHIEGATRVDSDKDFVFIANGSSNGGGGNCYSCGGGCYGCRTSEPKPSGLVKKVQA